jgi:hypothetical protein
VSWVSFIFYGFYFLFLISCFVGCLFVLLGLVLISAGITKFVLGGIACVRKIMFSIYTASLFPFPQGLASLVRMGHSFLGP